MGYYQYLKYESILSTDYLPPISTNSFLDLAKFRDRQSHLDAACISGPTNNTFFMVFPSLEIALPLGVFAQGP